MCITVNCKKNIFEHIFYEFIMYLYTYQRLSYWCSLQGETSIVLQNEYNMAWDAHFLHLRNLIEFFNDKKDCISVDDVLCCQYALSVKETSICNGEEVKFKQVINKTVDHLTTERLQGYVWSEKQIFTINEMISVMPKRINAFLDLIDNPENVKKEYRENLSEMQALNDRIRDQITKLIVE